MATEEQLDEIRNQLQIEITNSLNEQMDERTEQLEDEITRLRQVLQMRTSPQDDEDNMDILINSQMRDISAENRPQMSNAGLEVNNRHFRDLSNHELHQIKKIHQQEHSIKKKTILDESLGEIIDKCINFLTYSFDGYSKAYYKAELMEDVYDTDKTMYEKFKLFLLALVLFIRDDANILYLGIILVFISIIIYFVNITTS